MHHVDDSNSAGSQFYRDALQELLKAEIPFLVGGAYALAVHTGVVRFTKDFDIFVKREDVPQVLAVLSATGCKVELTVPHWLAKAFSGEDFIDVIFGSGNGLCSVDEEWFTHALEAQLLELELKLCPPEETIWQKAFILERDRCDIADVAHLFLYCAEHLDWHRLLRRFGAHWRILLAQIIFFDFIYPGHRSLIPTEIRHALIHKLERPPEPDSMRDCLGTLLSATQYLRDVTANGYRDVRLQPVGTMNPLDVAIWTANLVDPS